MAKTNSQTKRDALIKNDAQSLPSKGIGQLEREYFISLGFHNFSTSANRLSWLRSLIVAGGNTPTGTRESMLLIQALVARSLPVSQFLQQNYRTLYNSL